MGKVRTKEYVRGGRVSFNIPSYVDDVTLAWVNSRSSLQPAIWDLIKKEAHREYASNNFRPFDNTTVLNRYHQEIPQNRDTHHINNENCEIKATLSNVNNNAQTHTLNEENELGLAIDQLQEDSNLQTPNIVKPDINSDDTKASSVNESASKSIKSSKSENKTNNLDLNAAFRKKKKVGTLKDSSSDRNNISNGTTNKLAADILGNS